jgi:hypothetical protein
MDWNDIAYDREQWMFFLTREWHFWFHKMLINPWVASQLTASGEGLSYLELVSVGPVLLWRTFSLCLWSLASLWALGSVCPTQSIPETFPRGQNVSAINLVTDLQPVLWLRTRGAYLHPPIDLTVCCLIKTKEGCTVSTESFVTNARLVCRLENEEMLSHIRRVAVNCWGQLLRVVLRI